MGIAASSSSSSSPTTEAVPPREAAPAPPTADPQDGGADGAAETTTAVVEAESRECQAEWCFRRFMKCSGCKEEFVACDKCMDEAAAAGEDFLERCRDEGAALRKCMDAHADYYDPVLRAAEDEAAAAEAVKVALAAAEWCKARGWYRDCRFRWFMEGGGCKEEFVAWDKCVREAEAAGEDSEEPCRGVTDAIWKCMDAHADYYEPILSAVRAMAGDLKAAQASGPESSSPEALVPVSVGEDQKKQMDG